MESVGIITMHRVLNYGSVLQTWATQEVVKSLGFIPEIIDYQYPNVYQSHGRKKKRLLIVVRFFLQSFRGFPLKKKQRQFCEFIEKNLNLSAYYPTRESLFAAQMGYDVYMVGSDQVWNVNHTRCDDAFFLSFARQGHRKVSYASSFAMDSIPNEMKDRVKSLLLGFDHLSVRESNGAALIKELTERKAEICLDPTLLLELEDYNVLTKQSSLRISEPYILVYILKYAYDPYPYVARFIDEAHRQTGLKVVCIDFSARFSLKAKNVEYLHDSVSPADFVNLFSHAAMVITTSFHGTAFAVNFEKPLYSILNPKQSDDRMKSLLEQCDLHDCYVYKNSEFPDFVKHLSYDMHRSKLSVLRKESIEYLKLSLKTDL